MILINRESFPLVLQYLAESDRAALGQVNKTCRNVTLEFEAKSYNELQKIIREGPYHIYLQDGTAFHRETLLGVLGKGGSKIALELEEGRALLIPNIASYTQQNVLVEWKRIVHEEVLMSKVLTKLGLLSPLSKRVSIALFEDSHHAFVPAYMSQTFEKFSETHGWFIRDLENPQSSTWKLGVHYLFESEEDRLDEKNWDLVVDPLLTDIAKICIYHLPVLRDAQNLAIVKKPTTSILNQYELRYFGFDFSYKDEYLTSPNLEKKFSESEVLNDKDRTARREYLLEKFLDAAIFYEFGYRYCKGPESDKLQKFCKRLEDKYNQEVINRIKIMTA